jgi:GMP synthase-like glutamine amidotransferase
MPSLPLRIAILECDKLLDGARSIYGGYGGVFTALLQSGAAALEPPLSPSDLQISVFDAVTKQEYPSLESIDAVLLTGSRHDSFVDDPWILKLVEFVEEVLEQRRVRIIGVCFGHQIVGRALGAKVGRSDKGWETSVTAVDLTKKGQEIFGKTALVSFLLLSHQSHVS